MTDSKDSGAYWRKLKQRLKEEGSEVVTFCHALELKSPKDGKMYKTGVADMQGVFRIIQSVPSPKAEPFKMRLAEFGKERKENLRDNMSTTELILNMLAETATKDIAESTNPQGLE